MTRSEYDGCAPEIQQRHLAAQLGAANGRHAPTQGSGGFDRPKAEHADVTTSVAFVGCAFKALGAVFNQDDPTPFAELHKGAHITTRAKNVRHNQHLCVLTNVTDKSPTSAKK